MKYIIILITLLTLFSCDNKPTKVTDKDTETTIKIQQLANNDSILYKYVEIGDKSYIVNNNTKLVDYKIINDSAAVEFLATFLLVGTICIILIGSIVFNSQ